MIPIKQSNIKLTPKWPTSIIIHDTREVLENSIDTAIFQTGRLQNYVFQKTHNNETRYHYIIEKVNNDFYPIVSQPLFTYSEWEDIDPEYYKSVHIAFMGNYSEDIPMRRMYSIAAYKVICPLMRMFHLYEDDILLHKYISNDPNCSCPGDMFDFSSLMMYIRSYRKFKPLTRI